ncbi:hypothetical protein DB30_03347 [Enhygromyxa salina]|uniref:Uncharacterized protein n=1 Tax=Enhygromyxa salina TaxID=215803 RepID=A0A0C2A206_9BACT|nr:hypothetical protein [Enhygromyxa salina]KIG17428.1 hypothetical protein DB30_03347 [Enhygromyxa salina]
MGARESYDTEDEESALNESYGARPELPPVQKPVEKCTGKGKARECSMVDPQPEVTAARGARAIIGRFRWGMDIKTVMAQLEKDIEDEYAELQAKTKDPMQQDKNREWKREAIGEITKNHVRFETAAHHRWGVSLIGHEFKDNDNEEMIWIKSPTLKKFYFFKGGDLYKIVYAYGTQAWPGLTYQQILDEKFKTWFGSSPEAKAEFDEETQIKLIDYVQWNTTDGDRVRAFDMTAVHGAFVVSIVQGESEDEYGARLPTGLESSDFTDDVSDVLGGSDICYDAEGNMIEDPEKCKKIRGDLDI